MLVKSLKMVEILLYNGIESKQCPDCSYTDGKLDKLCGPCEENAIKERIKWWQDGKKRLQEKVDK